MISISLKWTGRCPKKHRYNPDSGPTFKSSCPYCQMLWRIRKQELKLRELIGQYDEAAQKQNGGFELE